MEINLVYNVDAALAPKLNVLRKALRSKSTGLIVGLHCEGRVLQLFVRSLGVKGPQHLLIDVDSLLTEQIAHVLGNYLPLAVVVILDVFSLLVSWAQMRLLGCLSIVFFCKSWIR